MSKLSWQLNELQKHAAEGSFSTQAARKANLSLIADQLKELGYNQFQIKSLKSKHVEDLVERWKKEELTSGTIKNRMTHIRWWAGKINKSLVVPSNEALGIEKRVYVTNVSKAVVLTKDHLSKIEDKGIQDSLKLQAAFGLRREESMKFNPRFADKGTHIELKPSWCKGNRGREVPITTPEQRELLDQLKKTYGKHSMIPAERRYIDQLNIYRNVVPESGLGRGHGLRHNYAQQRYKILSGNAAPANGGKRQQDMSEEERAQDKAIRQQISAELGHARIQVVAVYLGS